MPLNLNLDFFKPKAPPLFGLDIQRHDRRDFAPPVHLEQHKGHDPTVLFEDERLGARAVHVVGEFGSIVGHLARKAGFVDAEEYIEVRVGSVSNPRFH